MNSASAQYTWTGAVDDDWTEAGNWSGGATFPNGFGDTATFGNFLSSDFSVTLSDTQIDVESISFQNNTAFNLSIIPGGGSGLLTLDGAPAINYDGTGTGTFTINAPIDLQQDVVISNANVNGSLAFSGPITGSAALTKNGPGIVQLQAENLYTGDTNILGGTLQLAGTNTLGGSSMTFINLDGGTLETIGNFNTTTASDLQITSASTIKLSSLSHELVFNTVNDALEVLTIENWQSNSSGGRILFTGYSSATDANNQTQNFRSTVQFSGFMLGGGGTFIDAGGGRVELVPVPEPATVFALSAAGLGLVSWVRRRKTGETVEPTVA